ncbi:MAG: hypothetical protein ABS897_12095 [Eubacteriales bacterium]
MKKIVSLLMALALVLTLCASASAEMMVGGWEIVPAQSAILTEEAQPEPMMTDEAAAAFLKAMENLDGAEYIPVALLATQVVAGTNYCILCQGKYVVPDAKPFWALVYIYADLEGNAQILNIYELYIDMHAYPAETEE